MTGPMGASAPASAPAPSPAQPRPRSAGALASNRSVRLAAAERRLAFAARILDDAVAVPGTRHRVGIEPIVGLIPGAGDIVSAGVGIWLIVEASRFRLPASVVGRMALNTLVDLIVGLIPVIGDAFDFAFKSNSRNLALFRKYAAEPHASTTEHRLVLLGALAVAVGVVWLVVALVDQVARVVFG